MYGAFVALENKSNLDLPDLFEQARIFLIIKNVSTRQLLDGSLRVAFHLLLAHTHTANVYFSP